MTEKQIELARHALGLPNDRKMSYRNRFCASPVSGDYIEWQAMVDHGDAIMRRYPDLVANSDMFYLTLQGATKALKGKEKLDKEDEAAMRRMGK